MSVLIHHGGASPTLQEIVHIRTPNIEAGRRSLSAQPTGTESKDLRFTIHDLGFMIYP